MSIRTRLPDPVDPAAPPRRLLEAAAVVLIGGVVMVFVAVLGADPDGGPRAQPLLGELLVLGWALSLPVGAVLLLAFRTLRWWRLRRFERRAGFLPRQGRRQLPRTGRTTLFRVEYGQRAGRVCLMLARWDHDARGWHRSEVVRHAWLSAENAVALGAERARLTALAEQLEDEADDARLASEREHALMGERLAERAAARERTAWMTEQFARDSR